MGYLQAPYTIAEWQRRTGRKWKEQLPPWIFETWQFALSRELGLPHKPPSWLKQPAVMTVPITTPQISERLGVYKDHIRPFTVMTVPFPKRETVEERHVVEAVRELRERLRKEVLSSECGGTVHREAIDELNHLMAEHPMLTRLKASRGTSATELWFDPRQPEDLFAPLAHSAATLFAEVDRKRVRKVRTLRAAFL